MAFRSNCIVPIWALPPDSKRPIQIGSGVLIADQFEHVLLTAAHVMAFFTKLYVPMIPGSRGLFRPNGVAFWRNPSEGEIGKDTYDFGGFILDSESASSVEGAFTFLSPLDLHDVETYPEGTEVFVEGYPAKKGRLSGPGVENETLSVKASVVSESRRLKGAYSTNSHLFVAFNRRKGFVDSQTGHRREICLMNGTSGGAIFATDEHGCPRLAAIITEHHEKSHILVGTRIGHILQELNAQFRSRWGSVTKNSEDPYKGEVSE
ncbi:hypothetical protein OKA04_01795 [Luteolibacter flavescens]|uniref:Trypsin-like peptidase domain-containing protein n=1 Tax=Luteolibacter flavescens TaxID=1859460 RepID=A0ABT3FIP4_9BACT|nr:hypothetical protein [Luteolibacter flavescens]MCW1883442.1 hypothetical protein [Luteolibacter flavescens]